jgi:uncharacterized protein YjaZ
LESNIVFLESGRKFSLQQQRYIEKIILGSVNQAGSILGFAGPIKFEVYPAEEPILDSDPLFIGGKAMTQHCIRVDIPPGLIGETELKGTTFHETHHLGRGYYYSLEGICLLEAVFAEGLATVFEKQQVPQKIPAYSIYEFNLLEKFFQQLREQKWDISYNHEDWFFGEGERWWLGYKMGTYLVEQAIKRYPDETAASLVKISAEELLQWSGVDL